MAAEPSGRLARIVRGWHRAECAVALFAFGLIALLLMVDVIGRELLAPALRAVGLQVGATTIAGSQKIAVFALVLGAFAGVGIASATNSHLVPRVAYGWVPKAWSGAMDRLADVLTGGLMLVVAWYALQFVLASKASSMRAAVLSWEVWPFQLAIPLGFVSAAARHLLFAWAPSLKPPPPEFQE